MIAGLLPHILKLIMYTCLNKYKLSLILKPFISVLPFLLLFQFTFAQKQPVWDNTKDKNWNSSFEHVKIPALVDGNFQDAWFYKSTSKTPQPLIVSLHTWSGDYNQEDPLSEEVLLRDWNYIHPDFRGPNDKPEACGSPLVLSDILNAIHFAIKNANVDTTNVHIVGVSGGGYLTLLSYMLLNYPIKSFNAWAPISDLEKWYWESRGRHDKYAIDIEKVAAENGIMDWNELRQRSPIYHAVPVEKRKNSFLNIYGGVHDGYTGSVPISHSFLFYNKIVKALYPEMREAIIPDSLWTSILIKQCNPNADSLRNIGNRLIQIEKHLPQVSLTIFEGSHEMLVPVALALVSVDGVKNLKALNILAIGDSNGAFNFGWPNQLKKILPYSYIINKSIAGNTIGFDNLDQPELNTIKNIDAYLEDAYKQLNGQQQLDYLLIGLGTNDTKTIFKDRQKEVPANLETLINKIHNWLQTNNKKVPQIYIITPPPMYEKKIDKKKYGGNERLRITNKKVEKVAAKCQIGFINTWPYLNRNYSTKTIDGIHLKPKTQFELATIIAQNLNIF